MDDSPKRWYEYNEAGRCQLEHDELFDGEVDTDSYKLTRWWCGTDRIV
jgi:hypothetical protein